MSKWFASIQDILATLPIPSSPSCRLRMGRSMPKFCGIEFAEKLYPRSCCNNLPKPQPDVAHGSEFIRMFFGQEWAIGMGWLRGAKHPKWLLKSWFLVRVRCLPQNQALLFLLSFSFSSCSCDLCGKKDSHKRADHSSSPSYFSHEDIEEFSCRLAMALHVSSLNRGWNCLENHHTVFRRMGGNAYSPLQKDNRDFKVQTRTVVIFFVVIFSLPTLISGRISTPLWATQVSDTSTHHAHPLQKKESRKASDVIRITKSWMLKIIKI